MRAFNLFLFFTLVISFHTNAQFLRNDQFLGVGYEIEADPDALVGYTIKYIADEEPSFCFKIKKFKVDYGTLGAHPQNNFASYSDIRFQVSESGTSLKGGIVLTKDVTRHHLFYICGYLDAARVNSRLTINYYDRLYGITTKEYAYNYTHLTGELEFFAGWRLLGGHACIGGSFVMGYLNQGNKQFPEQINGGMLLHRFYFPDNGFGYYPFFFNALASVAISL